MADGKIPSVGDRMKKHAECVGEEKFPVVFCVRCGSTHIDQNFTDELRCYECGNTLAWDAAKFGINRYATEKDMDRFGDALRAFRMSL